MNKNSFTYKFTSYFISSPLTLLILSAFFIVGIVAVLKLPREEEPQISVPMVDIILQASGLKAENAVELVTKPLEVIIKSIPDVDHVYSQTEDDKAIVTARFCVGFDADKAILRIHEKIRAHLNEIPYGIPMPLIVSKSIDDVGVVVLSLFPKENVADRWNDTSLYELALKIQKELIKINSIGSSYIVGGRPEQLRIEPQLEKLNLYKITLSQLIEKISNANFTGSVNVVRQDNQSFLVTSGTNFQSISDLALLLVTNNDGKPVYLKDIAKIVNDGEPIESHVWFWSKKNKDFVPSVSISISKKPGTNAVDMSREIQERLNLIKGSILPDSISCSIVRDYGQTANEKSNCLLEDLFGATFFVILLMTLFLGWREGIVVMFVIPATVLGTLFFAWIVGFTINRVSLFALIFSIGILVDDAIVFIENIVRRWKESPNSNKKTTAVEAVVEVGNPTIIATFTIVVALLPMLFVSGLMGPYMRPIPINASIAMILSLFIAFSIVPWLLIKFEKGIMKNYDNSHKKENVLSRLYRFIATPLIKNRALCKKFLLIVLIATILALSLFFIKSVVVKMLPFDNKSEIVVQVDLKEGSTLEDTDRLLRLISSKLSEIPEILDMQLYVGLGAPFNFNGLVRHSYLRNKQDKGELQINLLSKKERNRESHAIALDIRKCLKDLHINSSTRVKVLEVPPGPPVLSTMVAEIYGPTAEVRKNTALKLKKIFKSIDFITDIDDSFGLPNKKIIFEIDHEKLNYYQIDEKVIYSTINLLLSSNIVGYSYRGEDKYPIGITVELAKGAKIINENFMNALIPSKVGLIELSEVVKTTIDNSSYSIFRHNGYDTDMVLAELSGSYEAPLYGMLEVNKAINNYNWGDLQKPNIYFHGQPVDESKTSILWDGEWEITYVTFRDMGVAFSLAVLGIYALLVAQFKNYRTPIVILFPIPLVLFGIIIGHWIFKSAFTATSMIGLISLAGIVVRNSLLLVEFIRHRLSFGDSLQDALIEAGAKRITPIFLTASSAMIGAVFMFFDPIFRGLALSLFFGLLSSTILTLLAIPALYVIYKT